MHTTEPISRPPLVLSRLEGHLAPGAVLSLHDFTCPSGVARVVWTAWMRTVAVLGARAWPEWTECFDRNLEDLVRRTRWPTRFLRALRRAGWTGRRYRPLTFG